MTAIEKMRAYIEKHERTSPNYALSWDEAVALTGLENKFEIIHIAFHYGRAKGYREGKREAGRP